MEKVLFADVFTKNFKKILHIPKVVIDDPIFRLHYKVTGLALLFLSIIVTGYQFIGEPIKCIQKDDIPENLLNTYCWIEGTFSLPKALTKRVGVEVVYPGVDKYQKGDDVIEHAYYQWVCFVLFLQAVMFCVPYVIWRSLEGGKMKSLVQEFRNPIVYGDDDEEEDEIKDTTNEMEDSSEEKRDKTGEKGGTSEEKRDKTGEEGGTSEEKRDKASEKGGTSDGEGSQTDETEEEGENESEKEDKPKKEKKNKKKEYYKTLAEYYKNYASENATWYSQAFLGCEILNFVNVLGQIFFLDRFLGGYFSGYGSEVVQYVNTDQENRFDPMIRLFPRLTKCTFHRYGSSGDVQKHDALCLLPLNILNEKIFVIMWFWLLILAVLGGSVLIYRFILLYSHQARTNLLKYVSNPTHKADIEIFGSWSYSYWFQIYMLADNIDNVHFRSFIQEYNKAIGYQPKPKYNYGEAEPGEDDPLQPQQYYGKKIC